MCTPGRWNCPDSHGELQIGEEVNSNADIMLPPLPLCLTTTKIILISCRNCSGNVIFRNYSDRGFIKKEEVAMRFLKSVLLRCKFPSKIKKNVDMELPKWACWVNTCISELLSPSNTVCLLVIEGVLFPGFVFLHPRSPTGHCPVEDIMFPDSQ